MNALPAILKQSVAGIAARSLSLAKYPPRLRTDQLAAYFNCSHAHIINLIDSSALQAIVRAIEGMASRLGLSRLAGGFMSCFRRWRATARQRRFSPAARPRARLQFLKRFAKLFNGVESVARALAAWTGSVSLAGRAGPSLIFPSVAHPREKTKEEHLKAHSEP